MALFHAISTPSLMRTTFVVLGALGILRVLGMVDIPRGRPRLRGVLSCVRDKKKRGLIRITEDFVKEELKNADGSHDWFHIHRVRNLAMTLARMEGNVDPLVVELAALLHDIKDWKYSKSETAGADAAFEFLQKQKCDPKVIKKVVEVMKNIGFKNELGNNGKVNITPELAVVQDADRLDAIGAIGIARTFTYGGSKNRALYDPDIKPALNITKEEYMRKGRASPTVNHFYEKLLLLKGKLKTNSARELAEDRHKYMEEFLERFYNEWDGKA